MLPLLAQKKFQTDLNKEWSAYEELYAQIESAKAEVRGPSTPAAAPALSTPCTTRQQQANAHQAMTLGTQTHGRRLGGWCVYARAVPEPSDQAARRGQAQADVPGGVC